METRIACPGGNACVSEALANHLEGKIETGATVAAISPEKDSYFVTYLNEQGQEMTLESRAVIWACQKHYAPYVIKGLSKDKIGAFKKVRYDAYLVANIFVNNPFYDIAFATYFEDTIFTDMVIADWMVTGGKKRTNSLEPEVYTLYCPLGEQNRYTLLSTPDEEWISQILQGLKKHFPSADKSIVDIKLFKYGHHYVIGYPGFASGSRVATKKPFGNIYFAKDDMQGVPCLESAVWSGIESAESVLQKIG